VLAIFDKPDPLEGPYFEETFCVTPSRLPADVLAEVTRIIAQAARALGLREGPVHAELRVHNQIVGVLELAARSIGGLCSRALRFGVGVSLEQLILRHALGLGVDDLGRESMAAGVMMIPIPRAGRWSQLRGKPRRAACRVSRPGIFTPGARRTGREPLDSSGLPSSSRRGQPAWEHCESTGSQCLAIAGAGGQTSAMSARQSGWWTDSLLGIPVSARAASARCSR
jgi:hypothetical protein